jgi:integrase
MMIRRNHTLTKEFTLPKTEAGTDRIINLIQPAIDVLKSRINTPGQAVSG